MFTAAATNTPKLRTSPPIRIIEEGGLRRNSVDAAPEDGQGEMTGTDMAVLSDPPFEALSPSSSS